MHLYTTTSHINITTIYNNITHKPPTVIYKHIHNTTYINMTIQSKNHICKSILHKNQNHNTNTHTHYLNTYKSIHYHKLTHTPVNKHNADNYSPP